MAAKNVTQQIGNALGVNETTVDILTGGTTWLARQTDKVVDDVSGVTKRKEEAAAQETAQRAAEADATKVQADSEERRKRQTQMKEQEYTKRATGSGGGRSGSVLGSAGMNANSNMKYKTLLGE